MSGVQLAMTVCLLAVGVAWAATDCGDGRTATRYGRVLCQISVTQPGSDQVIIETRIGVGLTVQLWDQDDVGADDFISQVKTNRFGYFVVSGTGTDGAFTPSIEPYLTVSGVCPNGAVVFKRLPVQCGVAIDVGDIIVSA